MIIGLDFDNTLASYDEVFSFVAKSLGFIGPEWSGTKQEIKKLLLAKKNGEIDWQRLQGKVYGQHMHMAKLFPGVGNFLLRSKYLGHRIVIVSHKTEYGHFDEEMIPLRSVAYDWMKKNNFFHPEHFGISPNDIHFKATQQEKIETIHEIGCHIFVDDLIEIHQSLLDFATTKRVLFGELYESSCAIDFSSSRWIEIDEYIFGDYLLDHIKNEAQLVLGGNVVGFEEAPGGGNSQIYKIYDGQKYFALKKYPTIKGNVVNRIEAEIKACKFMHESGIRNTPSVIATSSELNIAIYDWIDGVPTGNTGINDIEQSMSFIKNLKTLSKLPQANLLPMAAEACLSRQTLIDQIWGRILKLKDANDLFRLLDTFLRDEIEPVWAQLIEWQQSTFKNIVWDKNLDKKYQVLSPSDFGFHNALRMSNNNLYWLDFEYFGWDDPVKLVADFIWHPAMSLTENQQHRWIEGCSNIFSDDPLFTKRLRSDYPLYGMRWALILLNEFLVDGWHARAKAQRIESSLKADRLLNQINKSRKILNKLTSLNYEMFNRCG